MYFSFISWEDPKENSEHTSHLVSNTILQWTEPVLLEEMVDSGTEQDTDKMNVEHLVLPEIQGDNIKYKEII